MRRGRRRRTFVSAALAGEPFATLAAEFSASPSKDNGGLIGPFKLDELAPALQDVIKRLEDRRDCPRSCRRPAGTRFSSSSRGPRRKIRTFEEARGDVARRVAEQKMRGETAEVSRPAARAGQHRVAQRRAEEGVRARRWPSGACDRTAPKRSARSHNDPRSRRPPRCGSPSGRVRATSRSFASSSNRSRSKRSCRRSPSGAAGRIGRRRSTGRCFPATASPASSRMSACRS